MQARLTRRIAFPAVLCGVAAVSFALVHILWALTLPTPWVDEVHFMIPSISFAASGSFVADRMLVHQIYWIPVGFYTLNGSIFRLVGHATIPIARDISFLCVTAAALVLRRILSVALGNSNRGARLFGDAATLAWYISLPVIFAADIARPEAVALLLTFGALDCVLRRRSVGACGLTLLAVLVHPLLAAPAIVALASVIPVMLRPPSARDARWWEWLLLVLAGSILAAEAARLILDFTTYQAQWRFQLARKTARGASWLCLSSGMATFVAAAAVFLQCLRRGAAALSHDAVRRGLLLAFGCAAILVCFYGREMWYFPFLIAGLIVVLCTAIGSVHPVGWAKWSGVGMLAGSAAVLAFAVSTWAVGLRSKGVFGFQVRPAILASVAADRRHVASGIMDALRAQNAQAVLIDPFSFAFLDEGSNGAPRAYTPRAYTWSPLSRPAAVRFDHLVVLTRGYPSADPEVPAELLAGYVCTRKTRVASSDGRYEAALLSIDYDPSRSRTFLSCGNS